MATRGPERSKSKVSHGSRGSSAAVRSARVWVLAFICFSSYTGSTRTGLLPAATSLRVPGQFGTGSMCSRKGLITAIRPTGPPWCSTCGHATPPSAACKPASPDPHSSGAQRASGAVQRVHQRDRGGSPRRRRAPSSPPFPFWTVPAVPHRRGSRRGYRVINTFGNGPAAAADMTGFLKDLARLHVVPMFVVGELMALSGVLMILLTGGGGSARGRAGGSGYRNTASGPARCRLFNAPDAFADRSRGFTAAHPDLVRRVTGRRRPSRRRPAGRHRDWRRAGTLPAFADQVGPGWPTAPRSASSLAIGRRQICSVARAASRGLRRVLLGFGNYAGDVLHFGLSRQPKSSTATAYPRRSGCHRRHLQRQHRQNRETSRRRGDLAVFKRWPRRPPGKAVIRKSTALHRANDRTRTIGSGLHRMHTARRRQAAVHRFPDGWWVWVSTASPAPGNDVPADELGNAGHHAAQRPAHRHRHRHGTPSGSSSTAWAPSNTAVRGVPKDRATADRTRRHDVAARVGEFVTSYDMAGMSLRCWLDDELERYWAPRPFSGLPKGGFRRHGGPSIPAVGPAAGWAISQSPRRQRLA